METNQYLDFSFVYDMFMEEVPYGKWAEWLHEILVEYGIKSGLLLDLGCGTGTLTEMMSGKGYDMIGVDLSADMLFEAHKKREISGNEILYLQQDMKEFELYGTVRAVYSFCGSLNYILEEKELLKVFQLVNNYLDPGGYFIFDMDTRYKYEILMGGQTFCENQEEASFIWENYFDSERELNYYDLTLFLKEEENLYKRKEELHIQKAYDQNKIEELLVRAGLELVWTGDPFTYEDPEMQGSKIYYIAREKDKTEV